MNAGERWLPVVGHEDTYEVSDLGRVRTYIPFNRHPLPRIVAQDPDAGGYLTVRLWLGSGKRRKAKVHRLVLDAFLGPAPDKVTRHLNGDPSDNRLQNLAYGTQGQNIRDQVAHGTHPWGSATHCVNGHEFNEQNTYREPGANRRACRTCVNDRGRRYRERRAGKRGAA